MTSMAAALAASLPAPVVAPVKPPPSAKVSARMEGVVDVDAAREVESVKLNSLVFLKIMKHSTDPSVPQPQSTQQDRNAPPQTALSAYSDCLGVLLGLDLEGIMEVEDCFAIPSGETSFSSSSYSTRLMHHLREVNTPDSPVGIYLSTHNGGFVSKPALDLLLAIEKSTGRGKAVLVVHDASRAAGNELSVKAYTLSAGAREAAKKGKWDTASLIEQRITSNTLLTPLPLTLTSPTLLTALLSTLTSPTTKPTLSSPSTPLPQTFSTLTNPLPTSLPTYLSNTLDSLTLHSHESNNLAFMARQIAREKVKHESTVREREEENERRKKQGLGELPAIPAEVRGGTKEPNRLEMLVLQGQVEGLAKGMGAEAGKGLVRCYL